mgnify:FL=1|tara:strand:- start:505 stop:1059 length:555 start_codon:yes stop_codon:yes gene_type:complete
MCPAFSNSAEEQANKLKHARSNLEAIDSKRHNSMLGCIFKHDKEDYGALIKLIDNAKSNPTEKNLIGCENALKDVENNLLERYIDSKVALGKAREIQYSNEPSRVGVPNHRLPPDWDCVTKAKDQIKKIATRYESVQALREDVTATLDKDYPESKKEDLNDDTHSVASTADMSDDEESDVTFRH